MKEHQLAHSIFGEHQDERTGEATPGRATRTAPPPLTRAQRHRMRRRRRRGRRIVVLTLALALVAGGGFVAFTYLRPLVVSLTASNDYTGSGTGSVSVTVHGGDTGRTIGATLEQAGVVKTAKAFADVAANNPNAGSIQPGTYTLHEHMSAAAALTMLLDPRNRKVPQVTLREGLWKAEVFHLLAAATGQPIGDYLTAASDPAALGLPAEARGNLEGYLFPATYDFDKSAPAAAQLQTMVAKAVSELQSLGVPPAAMERTLTIASIVEAEARSAADRPRVARVIENRLAHGMPLQMDSTVHYLTQQRGHASTTNAERAVKSPYNTYLSKGLPPGPIDSPGEASLQAAAHPAPGNWLYFVTVNPDTGETRFAATFAQQQANEKLFMQWCTAHPDRC